jgi:hypothetical protein
MDPPSKAYLLDELINVAEVPSRFEGALEPKSLCQVYVLLSAMVEDATGDSLLKRQFESVEYEALLRPAELRSNASLVEQDDYNCGMEAFQLARAQIMKVLSQLAATADTHIKATLQGLRNGPDEKKAMKQHQSRLFSLLFSLVSAQQRRILLAKMFLFFGVDDQPSRKKRYVDAPPSALKDTDYKGWMKIIDQVNLPSLPVFPDLKKLQGLLAHWVNKLSQCDTLAFPLLLPIRYPGSYANHPDAKLKQGLDTNTQLDADAAFRNTTKGFEKYPSDLDTIVQTLAAASQGNNTAKLASSGLWWMCVRHNTAPAFALSMPKATVPTTVPAATLAQRHDSDVQVQPALVPKPDNAQSNKADGSNPSVHTPQNQMLTLALTLAEMHARTPLQDRALQETAAKLSPEAFQQVLNKLDPEDVSNIFHGDLCKTVADMGPVAPPRAHTEVRHNEHPPQVAPAPPAVRSRMPAAGAAPARVAQQPPAQPPPHPRRARDPEYYPADDDHEQWDGDGYGDGDAYDEHEGYYDEDPDYAPPSKYSDEYSTDPAYATTADLSSIEKTVRSLAINMVGLMTWNKMLEQGLDILQGHDGAGWRAALEGLNAFVPFNHQEDPLHSLTNNVKQSVLSALNFLPGENPAVAAALQTKANTQHTPSTLPAALAAQVPGPTEHIIARSSAKPSAPKLAKGGDVRDFLSKIQIYFALANVPAAEQINHALLNIESPDLVDMWLGHVKNSPASAHTFSEFAERLTIFAGGHSVQTKALDDFYSCRQAKQSVDSYIRKFNSLVTSAGLPYDSPVVINGFLRGLADDAFRAMICVHPSGTPWTNLSDLQAHASTRAVAARPSFHSTAKPHTQTAHPATHSAHRKRDRADSGATGSRGRGRGRGSARGRGGRGGRGGGGGGRGSQRNDRSQYNSGGQQRGGGYQSDGYRRDGGYDNDYRRNQHSDSQQQHKRARGGSTSFGRNGDRA